CAAVEGGDGTAAGHQHAVVLVRVDHADGADADVERERRVEGVVEHFLGGHVHVAPCLEGRAGDGRTIAAVSPRSLNATAGSTDWHLSGKGVTQVADTLVDVRVRAQDDPQAAGGGVHEAQHLSVEVVLHGVGGGERIQQ